MPCLACGVGGLCWPMTSFSHRRRISKALRRRVAAQARHRCGYCLTSQRISGAQMHIEHIVPLSRGGASDETNLWLACAWCNSYKGDKTHALDPVTGEDVPLFNPRTQRWADHFCWSDDGIKIVGLTSTGRATVLALRLNNEFILPARRHWVMAGWHPPQE
jgi:hypothetical protein